MTEAVLTRFVEQHPSLEAPRNGDPLPQVFARQRWYSGAERAGIDRLSALANAIEAVRRGGTLSVVGVYGGQAEFLADDGPLRQGHPNPHGQAHVKRWIPDLLPLVLDDNDPLATEDLATHVLPLADAPQAYEMFQQKQDG